MKARTLALVLVLVLLMAISTWAFDGQRKGFILGGGLGLGMTSYTQTIGVGALSITSDRETKGAFMTDFRIGYAPSQKVAIYYTNKVSWFSFTNAYDDEVIIASGASGAGCTYSLNSTSPSWFLSGGIAISTWALPFEDNAPDQWAGFGLFGGVGYEFARHVSAELDLVYGKPDTEEDGINVSASTFTIMLAINVLAY